MRILVHMTAATSLLIGVGKLSTCSRARTHASDPLQSCPLLLLLLLLYFGAGGALRMASALV
jgi:hypothetical protein